MWYLYLSDTPVSHLERFLSDVYILSASCRWVRPRSLRRFAIFLPTAAAKVVSSIYLTSPKAGGNSSVRFQSKYTTTAAHGQYDCTFFRLYNE